MDTVLLKDGIHATHVSADLRLLAKRRYLVRTDAHKAGPRWGKDRKTGQPGIFLGGRGSAYTFGKAGFETYAELMTALRAFLEDDPDDLDVTENGHITEHMQHGDVTDHIDNPDVTENGHIKIADVTENGQTREPFKKNEPLKNDEPFQKLMIEKKEEPPTTADTTSPADDRDHAKGMEILREIMAHFEIQGIREEDPYDATRSADYRQIREPKHAFGREKRSKPR